MKARGQTCHGPPQSQAWWLGQAGGDRQTRMRTGEMDGLTRPSRVRKARQMVSLRNPA